jgi:hypothetical protein
MVLTAYFVLSPATNSSCHRRWRIKGLPKPGRADFASANLTPATGARTTRLCRPLEASFVRTLVNRSQAKACPAIADCAPDAATSIASHPAFVTTRDPPLYWGGTAREVIFDLGSR